MSGVKRPSKRKAIEGKVLQKARKHVKVQEAVEEEPLNLQELSVPTINVDLKPRVKLRKPRWNDTARDEKTSKRLSTDASGQGKLNQVQGSPEKTKSKSKKKKGKKSKRKKDQFADPEVGRKHELESLEFLHKWNESRDKWKFEKMKQVWLLKNVLNPIAINDDNFKVLIKYLGSVQGHAQRQLQEDMQKVVDNFEQDISKRLISKPSSEDTDKYQRARQIIQMVNDGEDL